MKNLTIITSIAALTAVAAHGSLTPLNVVSVSAPAINCLFDPSCSIVVNDSVAPIPFPGWPANTPFFLQTRTYKGQPGSPAAGLYGYEYRIDLTPPHDLTGPPGCIYELAIDFGPNVPMDFDGSGMLSDVFITTVGGLGSEFDFPAAVSRDGNRVLFAWVAQTTNLLAATLCPGASTFFMGLVSTEPPAVSTAIIDNLADGFAFPGIPQTSVAVRVPRTNPLIALQYLTGLIEAITLDNWTGATREARGAHRSITLDLLEDTKTLVRLGETEAAAGVLRVLLQKVHGDWVRNGGLLYENIADVIDILQPGSPVSLAPPVTGGPGVAPAGSRP